MQQMQQMQTMQPVQQMQPMQQIAPAAPQAAADPQPEVQSLSKTELMRRERTREELKNEDILQERLEELRLRDEKRRTSQLLGESQDSNATNGQTAPIAGLATQAPQSEVVVSPVTARPGMAAPEVAPIPTAAQAQQYSNTAYTPAAQQQINNASMTSATNVIPSEDKPTQFYISPRAGIAGMNVNSSLTGVNVSGLYSLGVGLGMTISDNMAFEVGYSYNSYGISLGQFGSYAGQPYSYTLTQNVIDADLKLFVTGPDSKIRPFILAGGGYAMASLGYPSQLTALYGNYLANQSYNSNAFLGEIGVGMDVKVNKNISIGAQFKYNDALSSTNANNNFYYYGGSSTTPIGASLQQASFYSLQAGVTFSM
jgi:hypothetical protein